MTDEQLFRWDGVKPPRRRRRVYDIPADVELVDRPSGYVLLSNQSGVQGFHRVKNRSPLYGTVTTLCDKTGHTIADSETRIPLCERCERPDELPLESAST